MKKPKLIALDIDGVITIKESGVGKLFLPIIKVLNKLQSQGIICTLITGRGYYRVKRILDGHFVPNGPLVIENGARVTSWLGDDLVCWPLDKKLCDDLVEFYDPKFAKAVDSYQLNHQCCILALQEEYRSTADKFLPASQISLITSDPTVFSIQVKQAGCCNIVFIDINSDQLILPPEINSINNERNCIINSPEVSKGSGLRWMMNHLGLKDAEVLIAGNDNNDIDMFKLPVGWKLAIGNDYQQLKEHATSSLASPKELAEFLKTFLDH